MVDDTTLILKPTPSAIDKFLSPVNGESSFCGISIRGWLAIVPVGTMCFREICLVFNAIIYGLPIGKIEEPLYTVIISSVSFYFGQKVSQSNTGPTTNTSTTTIK